MQSESVKDNHFELTKIEPAFSTARLGTAQHRLEVWLREERAAWERHHVAM